MSMIDCFSFYIHQFFVLFFLGFFLELKFFEVQKLYFIISLHLFFTKDSYTKRNYTNSYWSSHYWSSHSDFNQFCFFINYIIGL